MEVVWTGPRASTSFLRATRQVVLDVLQGATSELLVVGCWISAKGSDIVSQIVSDSQERGSTWRAGEAGAG